MVRCNDREVFKDLLVFLYNTVSQKEEGRRKKEINRSLERQGYTNNLSNLKPCTSEFRLSQLAPVH